MPTGRARSWAASLLLLICAGTLLAPHRHLNPIADLVTDGRSDSGVIVVPSARSAPDRVLLVSEAQTLTDEPCLACFWHDMTASAAPLFRLTVVSVALAVLGGRRHGPPGPVFLPLCPSRGPPA